VISDPTKGNPVISFARQPQEQILKINSPPPRFSLQLPIWKPARPAVNSLSFLYVSFPVCAQWIQGCPPSPPHNRWQHCWQSHTSSTACRIKSSASWYVFLTLLSLYKHLLTSAMCTVSIRVSSAFPPPSHKFLKISEMRAADLVHAPLASVFTIYPLLHGSHTDMGTETVSQSHRNASPNSTS